MHQTFAFGSGLFEKRSIEVRNFVQKITAARLFEFEFEGVLLYSIT